MSIDVIALTAHQQFLNNLHTLTARASMLAHDCEDRFQVPIGKLGQRLKTLTPGSADLAAPMLGTNLYADKLPHRGSLMLVNSFASFRDDAELVVAELGFPNERLAVEHFQVVPGYYRAEALAQTFAAGTCPFLKDGYIPLLNGGNEKSIEVHCTGSELPSWAIIMFKGDEKLRSFAGIGLVGQGDVVTHVGAVLGTAFPAKRLPQ
jgi:hypothetical protein